MRRVVCGLERSSCAEREREKGREMKNREEVGEQLQLRAEQRCQAINKRFDIWTLHNLAAKSTSISNSPAGRKRERKKERVRGKRVKPASDFTNHVEIDLQTWVNTYQ